MPLISVKSDHDRIGNLAKIGSGFICVLESFYDNGSQDENLTRIKALVKTLKQISDKPVGVV